MDDGHRTAKVASMAQRNDIDPGALRSRSRGALGGLATIGREVLIVLAAGVTYAGVRELTEGSEETAVANAHSLVQVERAIGVAWEESAQSVVLGHGYAVDLANWMYIWGHWPVIAVVAIMLFAFRRDQYVLLRNAVLISGLIGFAFFALVPVAPPRLAGGGFVDTITTWSDSYRTLQPPRATNLYAAMPSLHFGWNLLVGIIVFRSTRAGVLRAFAVLMPAAMAFAVVATANHWVLDVVVGAAVVTVGLVLADHATRGRTAGYKRTIRLGPRVHA